MMRGDFDMGYPKDSLVIWYANGGLKSIERIYQKETDIEEFDSLSRRVSVVRYQNGPIITYRWRRSTKYFPNGLVKLKESDVNRIHKIHEYYPDGTLKLSQTKRRRVGYFQNGHQRFVYKWRRELELFEPHEKYDRDYKVHEKEYDENGKITQLAVYEYWARSAPPHLEFDKPDWIVSLKKFINGKQISSVSNVEVKESKK